MQLWHFWCNIVSSKLQRENKHRLIEPSSEYHLKWVTISNSASKSIRAQPFIHIEPHWSLFLGKCPITLQLSLELPKNYWDTSGLENEKKKSLIFLIDIVEQSEWHLEGSHIIHFHWILSLYPFDGNTTLWLKCSCWKGPLEISSA